MKEQNPDSLTTAGGQIQFSTLGLILFSVVLMVASAVLTARLLFPQRPAALPAAARQAPIPLNARSTGPIPPWGELVVHDINLEQPTEYLGFELANTRREPQWTFANLNRAQAKQLMLESGLPAELASRAVSDMFSTTNDGTTIIHPDAALLTGLTSDVRARFYGKLAQLPGNPYMTYPFCFPRDSLQQWFGDSSHDTRGMAIARKLFYPRGEGICFSDIEFLLRQLPSDQERMEILRSLSRQSAVLVRVRIRPDTDIDKLLEYWNAGAPPKDLRPLVESTARLQNGATISLLYFLPKFARERLYTFPMLTWQPNPVMDCHWSTMNFFNETNDNRFTGTTFTVPYLQTNFDLVSTPERYGDVILIQSGEGKTVHSAVHIADDIIFTKNGYSSAQPWMLMHLSDLLTRFSTGEPPKVQVYRKRRP